MNKLQKVSIFFLITTTLYLVFISHVQSSFELVEPLKVNCVESTFSQQILAKSEANKWKLYTWDLTNSLPQEIQVVLSYIESIREQSQQTFIFNLQGLRTTQIDRLKSLLVKTGGCWAYAPLWRRPSWLNWLHKLNFNIYEYLWDTVTSQESYEHGIWTGVIGDWRHLNLSAERWSLPSRPGRWPKRILHRQPAILAMNISYSDRTNSALSEKHQFIQVLNIKLADTQHKHQAGALALQSLRQPPLRQGFRRPWIMLGDWRVNPPNSNPHQLVKYRFQRFSLADLSETYVELFSDNSDPQLWGRWRLGKGHLGEPSVIDLAYASEGKLNAPVIDLNMLPWVGQTNQVSDNTANVSSTQMSYGEQRAPLIVEWDLGKSK